MTEEFVFVGQGSPKAMMSGSNLETGPHHRVHFVALGLFLPGGETTDPVGRLATALGVKESSARRLRSAPPSGKPVHGPFRVEVFLDGTTRVTPIGGEPPWEIPAVTGMKWESDGELIRWTFRTNATVGAA